ncbi:MAG: hypothetical protein ACRDOI_08585, partial [Trebonia sp.]
VGREAGERQHSPAAGDDAARGAVGQGFGRSVGHPVDGERLSVVVGRCAELDAERHVLAGVTVQVSGSAGPSAGQLSHLEAIREELYARYLPGDPPAAPAPPGPAPVIQDPDQRPS